MRNARTFIPFAVEKFCNVQFFKIMKDFFLHTFRFAGILVRENQVVLRKETKILFVVLLLIEEIRWFLVCQQEIGNYWWLFCNQRRLVVSFLIRLPQTCSSNTAPLKVVPFPSQLGAFERSQEVMDWDLMRNAKSDYIVGIGMHFIFT